MMKAKILLLALFSSFSVLVKAQFEKSDQKGTSNWYTDAIWLSDSVYVLSEYILGGGFQSTSTLSAYHLDEGLIWTKAAPDTIEIMSYNELIHLSDTTFGVVGYYIWCCDCSDPEPFLEIRNKANGNLVERVGEIIHQPVYEFKDRLTKTSWGFALVDNQFPENQIYYFNSAGDSLTAFSVDLDVLGIIGFQDLIAVAASNELRYYNSNGDFVSSEQFGVEILHIAANDDALLVHTSEGLLGYGEALNEIANLTFNVETDYELVAADSSGFLLYEEGSLRSVPSDFGGVFSVFNSTIQGFNPYDLIVNDENFVLAGAKVSDPFGFMNIRHRHAAFRQNIILEEMPLWETDIEISEIEMLNYQLTSQDEFSVYYTMDLAVTVRNDGTFPVNEFYINSVQGQGICAPNIEHLYVQDQILNGNESTYIFSDLNGWSFITEEDSSDIKICVFLTNPNDEIDNDRDNDSACATETIFLSTDDIELNKLVKLFPNPTTDQITLNTDLRLESYQIFDSFGRLVDQGVFNQSLQINLSSLTNGVYFLQAQSERGVVNKKFVVSR
jgi:hypothetical protein